MRCGISCSRCPNRSVCYNYVSDFAYSDELNFVDVFVSNKKISKEQFKQILKQAQQLRLNRLKKN